MDDDLSDEALGPLRHNRLRKLLPWTAGLSVFLLISGLIWVSTLKVTHVVRLFGQQAWVAGSRTALRAGVVTVQDGRFERGVRATITLNGPDGRVHPLFAGGSEGTATIGVNLEVPSLPPGPYELNIEARWSEEGLERRAVPIELLPVGTRLPTPAPRPRSPREAVRRVRALGEAPELNFDAFPTGPYLVSNMDNELFVLVTDREDRPVRATLSVDKAPGEHRTDAAGLATVLVQPLFGHELKLKLQGRTEDGRTGEAEAVLPLPPVQVRLLPRRSVVRPGQGFIAHVGSLRRQADLHCDLWTGGQWLSTHARPVTTGEAEFAITVPEGIGGPLLVQAYLNPSSPGRAHDHRLILAGPDAALGPTAVAAIRAAGRPLPAVATAWAALPVTGEAADYSTERLTRAALALAAGDFLPPPQLLDSYAVKQAELEAYQSRIRTVLVALLGGGGGLFLLVLFVVVGGHYRRTQRSVMAALEEASSLDDDEEIDRGGSGAGLELFALMGIMVLALAGLIYLLVNLRWSM